MRFAQLLSGLVVGFFGGSRVRRQQFPVVSDDVLKLRADISHLNERIKDLERVGTKVEVIENRLSKSFLAQLSFGFNLFSVLLVAVVIASLSAIVVVGMKRDFLAIMDLLAYLFPVWAGIFAGLGFYTRKPGLDKEGGRKFHK